MHNVEFVKYLKSNPATEQLLKDALRVSERTNKPVEQIISNVFETYKMDNYMELEDIEIVA